MHIFENWRGRKAWAKWQAKLAAQGESTNFQDYIPPSVPDEENFAATPIVQSWFSGNFDWGDTYSKASFPDDRKRQPRLRISDSIDLQNELISILNGNNPHKDRSRQKRESYWKFVVSYSREQTAQAILNFLDDAKDKLKEIELAQLITIQSCLWERFYLISGL